MFLRMPHVINGFWHSVKKSQTNLVDGIVYLQRSQRLELTCGFWKCVLAQTSEERSDLVLLEQLFASRRNDCRDSAVKCRDLIKLLFIVGGCQLLFSLQSNFHGNTIFVRRDYADALALLVD